MDAQTIVKNGTMKATVFNKNNQELKVFDVAQVLDEPSGDLLFDFDAAYREGAKVDDGYGICCNYHYRGYATSANYLNFY